MDINKIIKEVTERLEMLTPREVNGYAVYLCAYLIELSDAIAQATKDYYNQWERISRNVETVGKTEALSKGTEQYFNKKRLTLRYDSIIELIQALKKRQELLAGESKNAY